MKRESFKEPFSLDDGKIIIGYQEYSPRQKFLHFNELTKKGFRHGSSKDWVVIGVCTLDASMKIAMYCDDVMKSNGKFDIRDVMIAYELYKDIIAY